jgi:hypothetical protein
VWMVLAAASRGWPPAFEQLLVRIERWVASVATYLTYVTDEVPRFGLAAYDGEAGSPAAAAPAGG